jgi:2-(1,2-epoxy-1,2-dihydrophenyl)acetyl-CoA isomerase
MSDIANPILFSIAEGVARLILNRPDRLNAFTVPMHKAVSEALDQATADNTVRVLMLTGAGRGFCAGQDLGERKVEDDAPLDLGFNIETYYNPLARKLLALPFPVVCAVNGVAAGAGANLALLCDLVIARKSAKFIQSFANIGLLPDTGGTWSLPHLAGQARALGLALTGEPLGATQAAEWGLIWRVVEDDAFEAAVEALLAKLALAPTAGLVATKRAIRAAWGATLEEQLDLERDKQRTLGLTADYREGVQAFKEKRPPAFRGK